MQIYPQIHIFPSLTPYDELSSTKTHTHLNMYVSRDIDTMNYIHML